MTPPLPRLTNQQYHLLYLLKTAGPMMRPIARRTGRSLVVNNLEAMKLVEWYKDYCFPDNPRD